MLAMLAMLDVERDLAWWPRGAPVLPAVDARDLVGGGRALSGRICRWNRVTVAARDVSGMSSLTWTVWAC